MKELKNLTALIFYLKSFAGVKDLCAYVARNILTGGKTKEDNETQPHKLCQVSKYNLGGNETHDKSACRCKQVSLKNQNNN